MSKSHAGETVLVYEALFEDIIYALPHLKASLKRDLDRLRQSSRERGIHLFVVGLPLLGKHFDRCLSRGFYNAPGLPLSKRQSGVVEIPKFLGGLFLEIFGKTGCLRDDYSVLAIRFVRQILYLAKKLPLPFSEDALRTSVSDLFRIDASLPTPERFWSLDDPSDCEARISFRGFSKSLYYADRATNGSDVSSDPSVSAVLAMMDKVSILLNSALGHYRPEDWSFRHGPGAISQDTGPLNKYHWYGWSDRLESVYPFADCGFHNYSSWADQMCPPGDNYFPVSRLVAVPKTYEKPRLIAAEPSEHQWCQQNIWHYFSVRVQKTWIGDFIRFTDQSLNQALCTLGSSDGTLCTVDLSSASDRVSCHAVGNLFRTNLSLLQALRASRTSYLRQSIISDEPDGLLLKKFSTMGSACTFPVESLMFLTVAVSVALLQRRLQPSVENVTSLSGKVAVFGDDIIVPTDCRDLLQRSLEVLNFEVNQAKTYSEGFFRESCGVDCYKGECVTPIYWQGPCNGRPESVASTVDVANNFYKSFYIVTSQYLASTTPPLIGTVHADSDSFGFISRVGTWFPQKRWNKALQRFEVRGLCVSTACKTLEPEDDTALHQYFTEDPDPLSEWHAGTRLRPKLQLKFGWVDSSLV